MMFFDVFNFFAIVLEFFIPGEVGTDQNDNFFFLFQPLLARFGLK